MSVIKSFSVSDINGEQGDMFYIKHDSSNFTIIDCCLDDNDKKDIVDEIVTEKKNKDITRVISTHPDEDHICELKFLDEKIKIVNFYCVENKATKSDPSESFKYYCKLRDGEYHYYVEEGCSRCWMNENNSSQGKNYGSSGINFLWPITSNSDYKDALQKAKDGSAFNNISPIFTYSLEKGVKAIWMGDIEEDFVNKIKDHVKWPEIDILFAPHHGRDSGKVPNDVLKKLNPSVIVIGEAPAENLNYYEGYNTITQNSAKDIVFDCCSGKVHIYVSNSNYSVDFLSDERLCDRDSEFYIGSFNTHNE
jgi:beta-lactamase superfamily II metal-dependent hydrolase